MAHGACPWHTHVSKATWATAVAVTSAVFTVYLPSVFPSVGGGDSGELLAEACALGVAHPPGYPLFIYYARAAIAALPPSLGSPARRVNLATALIGAVAAGLLHIATVSVSRRVAGARTLPAPAREALSAAAAFAWAISPLVWLYHIHAEVFALSDFFVAALLVAFAGYADAADAAAAVPEDFKAGALRALLVRARWCALLCGLAMCNQHTSSLLIVPLAAWIAWSQCGALLHMPALEALRHVALCVCAALVGLLPYVHLPLAHALWRGRGSWGDASTLQGLLHHILRADYGTFRLLARDGLSESPWQRNAAWASDLAFVQMPRAWAPVLVVGVTASVASLVMALPVVYGSCGWRGMPAAAVAVSPASPPTVAPPSAAKPHASLAARAAAAAAAASTPSKGGAASKVTPPPVTPRPAVSGAHMGLRYASAVATSAPAAWLLFLGTYLAVFHGLSNMPLSDPLLAGVHARFWLHPNALAFPLVTFGGVALCAFVGRIAARVTRAPVTWVSGALAYALAAAAFASVAQQHAHLAPHMAPHAHNDVMSRYGRALIAPLPLHAVLVTSYDFQWTSTRYLQACEGFRPDVALLNAPVASYAWFSAQRSLYAAGGSGVNNSRGGVVFPGTHLVPHLTAPHAAGGFSLTDFVVANSAQDCGRAFLRSYVGADAPHATFKEHARDVIGSGFTIERGSGEGGMQFSVTARGAECPNAVTPGAVFVTGSVSSGSATSRGATSETAFANTFELHPHGLVSRVAPKGVALPTTWRDCAAPQKAVAPTLVDVLAARRAWAAAWAQYDGLPDVTFHTAATWEHATRIDFWAQAIAHGTWLLDWALAPRAKGEPPSPDFALVAEAASILEEAVLRTAQHGGANASAPPPPATAKNIGLAYVTLVRAPSHLPRPEGTPPAQGAGDAVGLPVLPQLRERAAALSGVSAAEGGLSRGPVFGLSAGLIGETQWRSLAAERVLELWSGYLQTREGAADPGRGTVEGVVTVLTRAAKGGAAK